MAYWKLEEMNLHRQQMQDYVEWVLIPFDNEDEFETLMYESLVYLKKKHKAKR